SNCRVERDMRDRAWIWNKLLILFVFLFIVQESVSALQSPRSCGPWFDVACSDRQHRRGGQLAGTLHRMSTSLAALWLIAGAPVFDACRIGNPAAGPRMAAECTTLSVPENPDDAGGRQITLKVARLKAMTGD